MVADPVHRARMLTELGTLLHQQLDDMDGAESFISNAIQLDPLNVDAFAFFLQRYTRDKNTASIHALIIKAKERLTQESTTDRIRAIARRVSSIIPLPSICAHAWAAVLCMDPLDREARTAFAVMHTADDGSHNDELASIIDKFREIQLARVRLATTKHATTLHNWNPFNTLTECIIHYLGANRHLVDCRSRGTPDTFHAEYEKHEGPWAKILLHAAEALESQSDDVPESLLWNQVRRLLLVSHSWANGTTLHRLWASVSTLCNERRDWVFFPWLAAGNVLATYGEWTSSFGFAMRMLRTEPEFCRLFANGLVRAGDSTPSESQIELMREQKESLSRSIFTFTDMLGTSDNRILYFTNKEALALSQLIGLSLPETADPLEDLSTLYESGLSSPRMALEISAMLLARRPQDDRLLSECHRRFILEPCVAPSSGAWQLISDIEHAIKTDDLLPREHMSSLDFLLRHYRADEAITLLTLKNSEQGRLSSIMLQLGVFSSMLSPRT